jgi:hypothetical protein
MSRMIYLPLPLLILVLSLLSTAYAERVQVFDIKKSLPMSAKDPVHKDYYLSGGRSVGLKENMIVTVYRQQQLHDYQRNEPRGQLKLKVGQMKLIMVAENNAIGRFYRHVDMKSAPVLEFDSFQLGDLVELTDAYFEKAAAAETPGGTPGTAQNSTPASSEVVIQLKAGESREPAAAPSQTVSPITPQNGASPNAGVTGAPTTAAVTPGPSEKKEIPTKL